MTEPTLLERIMQEDDAETASDWTDGLVRRAVNPLGGVTVGALAALSTAGTAVALSPAVRLVRALGIVATLVCLHELVARFEGLQRWMARTFDR